MSLQVINDILYQLPSQGIPLVQAGLSAASRQIQNPSSPPPPPVADDSSSALDNSTAVNDRYNDDLEGDFDDLDDDENTVTMEMKI